MGGQCGWTDVTVVYYIESALSKVFNSLRMEKWVLFSSLWMILSVGNKCGAQKWGKAQMGKTGSVQKWFQVITKLVKKIKSSRYTYNPAQVEVPSGSDLWSNAHGEFPDKNYKFWDLVPVHNSMIRGHFGLRMVWSEVTSGWFILIRGGFKGTLVWSEKILSAIGSDQRPFRVNFCSFNFFTKRYQGKKAAL